MTASQSSFSCFSTAPSYSPRGRASLVGIVSMMVVLVASMTRQPRSLPVTRASGQTGRRDPLQLSQIRNERSAFLGRRPPIEVHAIGRRERWHRATRRGIRLHELEELDVVVDHLLERGGAVVVEVRRRFRDATKSRNVELLPVVQTERDRRRTRSAVRVPDPSSSGEPSCRRGALPSGSPSEPTTQSHRFVRSGQGPAGRPQTRIARAGSTGRGHWLMMRWNRMTGAGGTFGVACGVDCPGPPWHWLQARVNTALPSSSSGVSRGSGSGSGSVPARTASARTRTR